jgi:hypothetical protein
MATVYLARDLRHRRRVALKLLHPELAYALGADRFLREIEVAANLTHPHILPLFDSGEVEGLLYYVMPYVEGESLRDRLTRAVQLPIEEAVGIAGNVAAALAYAHGQGIIHRDIKPENILLEGDEAVVADFGIAKAVSAAGGARLTETGLAVGTAAYMSPEQASGASHLDGRSDVYSLGCVLYEMLAGEPPYTGPTAQAIIAKRFSDPVPALRRVRPAVPERLDQIVTKALAPVPADRWPTAQVFRQQLSTFGRTSGTMPTVGVAEPPVPEAKGRDERARMTRRRLGVWLALSGALVAAVAAVLSVRTRPAPTATTSTSVLLVAPFGPTSPDSALAFLGRDLVVTLSASLDGVGELRAIEPTTVLAQVPPERSNLTLDAANTLARRLGAGRAVHGSLLRLGSTVRLDLGLFPTDGRQVIARAAITAPADSIGVLTDSAAWVVLRGLWQGRDAPTPSPEALVRRKPEAVRAFLDGERALLEGRWQSAWRAYQRTIDADTTLWLAYGRYQYAREYNGLDGDSLYQRRFWEHRGELPEPERLLAEAEADTVGTRSEIAARCRVAERFPDFWWGSFSCADWLVHYGSLVGYDPSESRRWLDRTLELNSRFAPGWEHLIWVTAAEADTLGLARALAALERINAGPELAEGWGYDIMPTYRLIIEAWRREGRHAVELIDTVAREVATTSPLTPAHWSSGDMLQYGWPALEIEIDRRLKALSTDSEKVTWSRRTMAHAWAARGAWDSALTTAVDNAREARTTADSRVALRLAVIGAWVEAVSWDEVKRIREAVAVLARPVAEDRTEIAWLDGVAAVGRGDRAALTRAVIAARDPADPNADRLALSLQLLGRVKHGGREVADSLALLAEDRADRPRDSSIHHPLLGALLNFEAGRLQLRHGDTVRATRLLVWPTNVENLPHAVRLHWMLAGLAHLQRGRVAEAQDQRERALHHYREFLRRYDMPVPAHRHLVTEAEVAVSRLKGEEE